MVCVRAIPALDNYALIMSKIGSLTLIAIALLSLSSCQSSTNPASTPVAIDTIQVTGHEQLQFQYIRERIDTLLPLTGRWVRRADSAWAVLYIDRGTDRLLDSVPFELGHNGNGWYTDINPAASSQSVKVMVTETSDSVTLAQTYDSKTKNYYLHKN